MHAQHNAGAVDRRIIDKPEGRRWHKIINAGGQPAVDAAMELIGLFFQGNMPWRTNDPALDAKQRASYDVRVLEIPTPRWTASEAKRFGIKLPKEVPMTTQERAYTSPIWYTPAR